MSKTPLEELKEMRDRMWARLQLNRAAPLLLEALEELLPMQGCAWCQEIWKECEDHGDIRQTITKAEAAIAKARMPAKWNILKGLRDEQS